MPEKSYLANGTINPSRFVKLDTTTQGRVLQCGAGDKCLGISQLGTRRSPEVDSSGNAAQTGEPLGVHDEFGELCGLTLGGTVTVGDRLKSDANGKGVTTTTDQDEYGAIAKMNGVSGDVITVEVTPFSRMS